MTGLRALIVYSIAYLLVAIVNHTDILIDVKFIFCVIVNLSIVSLIAVKVKDKTAPVIILLFSMLLSSLLVIIQYNLLLPDGSLAYNQSNAIISKMLPILTLIDVFSMIWITLDGLFNKSRPDNNERYTSRNIVNANCNADRQSAGGVVKC